MKDMQAMLADALLAAKVASGQIYSNHYMTGDRTIACREPDDRSWHYTSVHSWDYARQAGVSSAVALVHLRKLAAAGLLIELRRVSSACVFRPRRADSDQIGCEVIAELRAQGLPFDDEWRASQAATRGAA